MRAAVPVAGRFTFGVVAGVAAAALHQLLLPYAVTSILDPKSVASFVCGLLFGPAALGGIAVGGIATVLARGRALGAAVSTGALHVLVGAVAYAIFRFTPGLRRDIGDLRSYLAFLASVVAGAASLATVGSAVLFAKLGFHAYWNAVVYWFGSAITSLLVVAPCVLLLVEWLFRAHLVAIEPRPRAHPPRQPVPRLGGPDRVTPRRVLIVGLSIVLVTLLVIPVVRLRPQLDGWLTLAYLVPILWCSIHHGLRGGLLSASASGVAYLVGTVVGGTEASRFVGHEQVVTQFAGLAVFSIVGAVTGAFQQERFRAEEALLESNEELRRRHRSLELLNHLADRLQAAPDVERIVAQTVAELVLLEDPPRVAIFLVEPGGVEMRRVAHHGFDEAALAVARTLPVEGSLNGEVMRRQEVLVADDPSRDERVVPEVRAALARDGERTLVAIPLIVEERSLGVIDLLFRDSRTFAEEELETFRAIGQTVGLAIVSAQRLAGLERQATHDSLTGLPNRTALHRTLPRSSLGSGELGDFVALLLFDIDRFKEVNDALGHHLGDRLLTRIGPRVERKLGGRSAKIFRLGGDEFALMIPRLASPDEAVTLATELRQALQAPFEVDGLALQVGASAGVAVFPLHAEDSHELLRCADVAMYQAKRTASGVAVYHRDFDKYTPARLALAAALGRATEADQLRLHYQPKIELADGALSGFEALVRWQHPRLGLLLPGEFIPIAEVGEQIHPLTYWVVEHALLQQREWCGQRPGLTMAINLSARCLLDQAFPRKLGDLIDAAGIEPGLVELELTETALMSDPARALQTLSEIAESGVRLVIDDFGAGYSSLAYLRRFPVQGLKIDRSFVAGMTREAQSLAIVRSTVDLCHELGLTVVAEGVEDATTVQRLREIGCTAAQGFYFARPAPPELIEHDLLGRSA